MTSCGIIDTNSRAKIDYYKNLTHKHKNKLIVHVTLLFYLSHLVEDTKPNIQTILTILWTFRAFVLLFKYI
jgi:hypothetical protein